MNIRAWNLGLILLLLLQVSALNVHRGFARVVTIGSDTPPVDAVFVGSYSSPELRQRYFYVHNETRIDIARAKAGDQDGGGRAAGSTYPDFAPAEDGCNWDSMSRDLSFHGAMTMWDASKPWSVREIQILAVDSCAEEQNVYLGLRNAYLGQRSFEICSENWVKEKHGTHLNLIISDDPHRAFKVLVVIRGLGMEVLADGIYSPATGKMQLVGCTHGRTNLPDLDNARQFRVNYLQYDTGIPLDATMSISSEVSEPPDINPHEYWKPRFLNSSGPEVCAISVTLQYPPLSPRWNSERILKLSFRSTRDASDPLYFAPIEQSTFFPYSRRYSYGAIQSQRRLETWGRMLLLVLGLVCIAKQIEHGRHNEEALPFVSLVMLGIQLANHLSQTSIFKDLQISGFYGSRSMDWSVRNYGMFQDSSSVDYYGTMAWSEHVPYQAMAMAAIFMYVWIVHRVGDRRRIMELRVRRKRPGAKDPPTDWLVFFGTLVILWLVETVAFFVVSLDEYAEMRMDSDGMFVSSRFYVLSQEQWGVVNRLAGLVVSFFLVPQLLGNAEWSPVQAGHRPLSKWFYAGIPFLQSLPHVFSIAKHFQLLPIFPLVYDPYLDSTFGIFRNPTAWWQIGVVLCTWLQVLVVHSQFAATTSDAQPRDDML